ncbi:putative RNA dependent RNA polymerase [Ourmia melon virus]|uniref:RNA-dependent RNA polymerase n=1 Tax=Ourmia melon virus (isolate Melon/Iran/VE9) TaxID=652838 RepID=RDRP_OUMVV|nr:putative RNA dependent RNA polymerase [Ourmia melon virus]B3VML1.1 RecName: Full=RNA-dependent RNA polymerase [Ourmia melon virus VE9]ACF16360.1 putative RNA dependent RNA polymerase [Ourmia melon virus]
MEPRQELLDPERVREEAKRIVRWLCGLVDRTGKLPAGDYQGKILNTVSEICKRSKLPCGELAEALTKGRLTRSLVDYSELLISNLVVGYFDVLEIYLGKQSVRLSDIREMACKYTFYAINRRLEDYIKFQTAWLQARAMRDVTPEPEAPSWLNEGFGRCFSALLNRKVHLRCVLRARPNDVSLAASLYQVKRVAPPLPDDQIEKNLEKSLDRLTKDEEPAGVDEPFLEDLKRECKRTVDELVQNARREGWNRKISRDCFPSQSAAFENPISKGGQLGQLVKENNTPRLPVLLGMFEYKGRVTPVYGWADDGDTILSDEELGREVPAALKCRRSPVLEPFKVRVITMGPAVQYYRARRVQGCLWDLLKHTRCTHLPNRPVEESDIGFYVRRRGADLFRGEEVPYVSGDYSAATDNLHPDLSLSVVDRVCDHLLSDDNRPLDPVSPWRVLFHRVLVGHRIYDGNSSRNTEVAAQSWGQLMGSPLSFPVLCIVNLAVTRYVLEKACGRIVTLEESGILVNGDDILFRCPERTIPFWTRMVTIAGLSPSPGKNFVSYRYCQLNSELYDMSGSRAEYLPFIKANLIYGTLARGCERKRAADLCYGDTTTEGGTFGHRARALIKGFGPDMQDRLMSRFLHSIKGFLEKIPEVSWFIHPRYGGLGLPLTRPVTHNPYHLRIAAYLSCGGEQSQEARCMMQWLSAPTKSFNAATLLRILEVARNCKVPFRKVPFALLHRAEAAGVDLEALFRKALLRSAPRLGVEYPSNESGDMQRLGDWRRFFRDVGRKAARTRCRSGTADERKGLFLMSPDNAVKGPQYEYIFDWASHNMGGNIWDPSYKFRADPFSSSESDEPRAKEIGPNRGPE